MFSIMTVVVIISVIWTYFDAKKLCAKVSELGINHTYSPGFAAFMVAAIWIVCFPLYLYQSRKIKKDIAEIEYILDNKEA